MSEPTGNCKDCPDPQSVTDTSYHYILYLGGPAHAQFLALRQLIPARNKDYIAKYEPSIRDDGSIVYSGGIPPVLEGFRLVDGAFVPQWPLCPYRVLKSAAARQRPAGSLRLLHTPTQRPDAPHEVLDSCGLPAGARSDLLIELRVRHPSPIR